VNANPPIDFNKFISLLGRIAVPAWLDESRSSVLRRTVTLSNAWHVRDNMNVVNGVIKPSRRDAKRRGGSYYILLTIIICTIF